MRLGLNERVLCWRAMVAHLRGWHLPVSSKCNWGMSSSQACRQIQGWSGLHSWTCSSSPRCMYEQSSHLCLQAVQAVHAQTSRRDCAPAHECAPHTHAHASFSAGKCSKTLQGFGSRCLKRSKLPERRQELQPRSQRRAQGRSLLSRMYLRCRHRRRTWPHEGDSSLMTMSSSSSVRTRWNPRRKAASDTSAAQRLVQA